MNWNELIIHTTTDAVEPVAHLLNELGANGVLIEDPLDLTKEKQSKFGEIYEIDASKYPVEGVYVKAYFVDNAQWIEKEKEITEKINALESFGIDLSPNKVWTKTVQEKDWENEWKQYFKPTKVTNRFVIVPNWEQYDKKDPNELIITIDPGMAFGTGTHPTTILSLQALEQYVEPGDTILDVGSGSGILSIAACKLAAEHVYSYDLDDIAVTSTSANRDLNELTNKITVAQSDLLKDVHKQANVIVSNILADILLLLIDDAWDNLQENGYFITSGIIVEKQQMVESKLKEKGFIIVQLQSDEHWVSIVAQKISQ